MEDEFHFYAEVRVISFPERPELEGVLGAILGISEPKDADTPPSYGVMLDEYDRVVNFDKEQILPTGRDRRHEDYY